MLDLFFKTLGFTDKEAALYLALVEVGAASANDLARAVGTPRTTAYSVLASLSEKGLVSLVHENSKARYVANKPEALEGFLQRERKELEAKEKAAAQITDYITPYFQSSRIEVPKLQVFDGDNNVERMLYDYLPAWEESMSERDNFYWGYQDSSFVEHYRPWLDFHWKRMQKSYPLMRICLYSNDAEVERDLAGRVKNREIRKFPISGEFKSSIWIMGDYVVMVFTNKRPHYAFQLRDESLSSNLRSIFRVLWSVELPTVPPEI